MTKRLYFDYNATAPLRPVAFDAMQRATELTGNPSSPHAEGRAANACIDDARHTLADTLGARPSEIIFTSGGTEAINTALRGACPPGSGGHIVCTAIEHAAVLETARRLEGIGTRLSLAAVDREGRVTPESLAAAIEPDTRLVNVMHANNEVGTVQDIAALVARTGRRKPWFHCDAIQTFGRLPVNVRELGVDLLSVSAHKLGGPRGVGALFVATERRAEFEALLTGGAQERQRRAGTENVSGIAGFAAAAGEACATRDVEQAREAGRRDRLWALLQEQSMGLTRYGCPARALPNTLSVGVDGLDARDVVMRLDLEGMAASAGSACSTGAAKPSHVLAAMVGPGTHTALRLSLGWATTEGEIDQAATVISTTINAMR